MLAETKIKDKERLYTPAADLKLEEAAESKSEYIDGKIIPITGGTLDLNRLILNLCLFLKVAFKVKEEKYDVFTSDVRLWIPHHRVYTYSSSRQYHYKFSVMGNGEWGIGRETGNRKYLCLRFM